MAKALIELLLPSQSGGHQAEKIVAKESVPGICQEFRAGALEKSTNLMASCQGPVGHPVRRALRADGLSDGLSREP
jgi:hypothetical protein